MRLKELLAAEKAASTQAEKLQVLSAVDDYIMGAHSTESGKLEAIKILDRIVGLPEPPDPVYALKVYMATRGDHFKEGWGTEH